MNRYLKPLALAALAIAICEPVLAQRWIGKGGPEAYVRAVRLFSATPSAGQTTLFAATLGAGVVKIVDDGSTQVVTPVNTGLPDTRIRAIAGTATTNLYVATEAHGVYRSGDGGATWQAVNGAGATKLGCVNTRAITTVSATEVWVGTACRYNSGVYKSADSGATWTRIGAATIPGDSNVNSVTINSAGTVIMVATDRDGLYRSADSGATFAQTINGLPAQAGAGKVNVLNVQFRATTAEMLAYVKGAGIYLSTDSGANWAASNTGLPGNLQALGGIGRESATIFYISADKGGLYKSTDGGATWSPWGTSASDSVARFPRNIARDTAAGRAYVPALSGLARTTDDGATFSSISMPASEVNTIAIANDQVTAYATTDSVFRIANVHGDLNCPTCATEIASGLPGNAMDGTIHTDSQNPGTLYVSLTNFGLFKSTNDGASWSALTTLPRNTNELVRYRLDPVNTQTIWAYPSNPYDTTTGGGIYKSTDGGATWSASSAGLTTAESRAVQRLSVNVNATNQMFIATAAGLYRSTDSGANWSSVFSALDGGGNPQPFAWVVVHPTQSNVVFASSDTTEPDGTPLANTGVLRSLDGGNTWTNVLPGKKVRQVRVEANGRVYALLHRDLADPQVMISYDNGGTWKPFDMGLPPGEARNVAQTSAPLYRVVALSSNSGIYALAADSSADFNADGRPDIIWSNTTSGATYVWRMNGPTLISDSFYATIDPSWKIQGVADFNGDGHPDIVWRNTINGSCYVWYTVNGVFTGTDAFLFSLPPEWVIQGVADFNGDGKPDFLMRNSVSGNAFVWYFNNASPIGDQFLFNIDPSWKVEQVGDLNADGQPDLLFRSMTSGLSFAWYTTYTGGVLGLGGSSPMIYSIDPVWEVVQLADWNADGKPDLLFRNATTGLVFVWYLDGVTLGASDFVYQIDPSWEIVPRR